MFRIGEEYYTVDGRKARIICTDANMPYGARFCNIVAILDPAKGQTAKTLMYYDDDGIWPGQAKGYAGNIVSNEPTKEEVQLINNIIHTMQEFGDRDANTEKSLLKIIRQLRKK